MVSICLFACRMAWVISKPNLYIFSFLEMELYIYIYISFSQVRKTSALTIVLTDLRKYTNYTIQVLAYTRVGDGVPTTVTYCQTEEDGIVITAILLYPYCTMGLI